MAFHVGFLTGPTLGGFLIDTLGWRWIFLSISRSAFGAHPWRGSCWRKAGKRVERISIDFPGAILLMTTCSLLIYGMNQLPHVGWHDPTVLRPLGLFVVALALFIFVELRSPMPILSFALFRNRLFTASMFSLFFITSTQSAISFLLPF